jgi:hypothetical protein
MGIADHQDRYLTELEMETNPEDGLNEIDYDQPGEFARK